jgi:hypothetical protein
VSNNEGEQSDAEKVLNLATESSDMLHNIESVFSQTVEGASRMRGI